MRRPREMSGTGLDPAGAQTGPAAAAWTGSAEAGWTRPAEVVGTGFAEVVDLTRPLFSGMPVFPGDPPVSVIGVRTHAKDGYQVSQICLGSHSGTHIDAPRHFFPNGRPLDDFPASSFVGRGLIVDARPAGTPRTAGAPRTAGTAGGPTPVFLDAVDLADRLRPFELRSGDFVLLWTEGAFLTEDAARLLLAAGVSLVATDGDSLDPRDDPDSKGYPVHNLLLGHDVLLVEGLCNLEQLGPGPVTCAFLPLAIAGADGAPIRAVAWR